MAPRPVLFAAGSAGLSGPAGWLPRALETLLVLIALPLLGALTAYRLTTPDAAGPLGIVRVAEAPPPDVAGARAGALPAPGASWSAASDAAQRTYTPTDDAGGPLQAPEGITVAVPPGIVSGAGGNVQLAVRPLQPPPDVRPNVLRAVDLSATLPDGRSLGRFPAPLTVTLPYDPAAITGWVTVAVYDLAAGAWVEVPGVAVNAARGTVTAPIHAPTAVALVQNRPPAAIPDTASVAPDTTLTLNVLENDLDPDGDPLGVFLREEDGGLSAAGGAVACTRAGLCAYTPPPGFTGTDTFTYGLGDLRTHPSGAQTWSDNVTHATVTVEVLSAGS